MEGLRTEDDTLLDRLGLVGGSGVVEARLAVERELQLASDDADEPNETMTVRRVLRILDRHEVDHLADAVRRHEPRDQDRRVREIQLPGDVAVLGGSDPEVPAALGVEQRSEHARRVKARTAEPVDRAVGRDERSCLQVADQPVIRDQGVVHLRLLLPTGAG